MLFAAVAGCMPPGRDMNKPEICSTGWEMQVEEQLNTGDASGHGPDVGSEEWKSVVEFKLGIRGSTAIPDRASIEWCRHIDSIL